MITYFLAYDGHQPVGFASLNIKNNLWQMGDLANLDELVVAPGHRNQGLGSQLIEHVKNEARKRGCTRLELNARINNETIQAFYESRGFRKRAIVFTQELTA